MATVKKQFRTKKKTMILWLFYC